MKLNRLPFIYACLWIGALMQGIAMSVFLFPHSIPSGGGAGLALLMNYFLELPLGFALWIANAVFLLFGLKYFGFRWTFRTILSVAITSTTVSVLTPYFREPALPLLVDMALGSLFFGTGVGLLIRAGASSGGMVIPALMIANYRKWSPGKVMLGINLLIFSFTALVIDYKIVFLAVVCQFLSTNIIDFIYRLRIQRLQMLHASLRRR